MANITEILASNIRYLRKQQGLTQEALAERLGVTYIAVQGWESKRRFPKPELMTSLATVLNVPESRLMQDPETTPRPTLAEALDVVRDELGIEITPVKTHVPAVIPADVAKDLTSLPSSAWDAIRAVIAGVKLNK